MRITHPSPPLGSIFQVGHADDGALVVRYQVGFDGGLSTVWILWAAVAMYCTVQTPPPVSLPVLAALWGGNALLLLIIVHEALMTTTLLFEVDQLLIEKRSLWYHRVQTIHRREIRAIQEIDDHLQDSEFPPGWSLVLLARERIPLITSVTRSETLWLSSLLARWAGVPVIPWQRH